MVKYIENIGKDDTVEDVAEIVNALCLGMTEGVKVKDNKVREYSLKKLDNEILQVNRMHDIFRPDAIDMITGGTKARIKRFIKKAIRKVIRPVLFSQVEFNAHTAAALNEIKELINQSQNERVDYGIPDDFYLKFEDAFRGTSEEIEKRVEFYAEIFEGRNRILDIGCGRGELLEALKDKSPDAYGIDVNSEMVRICREKNLKVLNDDAVSHLNKLEDNSLDGIVAIQVVEHLELKDLYSLIQLANKKLKQNGLLVLETCNPLTLGIYCYGFYIDPTHTKPVHPAMLKFMAEYCGFHAEKYEPLHAFPEEYRFPTNGDKSAEGLEKLNVQMFGAQDYMYVFKK